MNQTDSDVMDLEEEDEKGVEEILEEMLEAKDKGQESQKLQAFQSQLEMKYQLQLQEEKQRMQQYLSDQFRQLAAATLDPYMEGVEIQSINAAQAIDLEEKDEEKQKVGEDVNSPPGLVRNAMAPFGVQRATKTPDVSSPFSAKEKQQKKIAEKEKEKAKMATLMKTARHGTVELGRQEDHSTLFGGAVGHSRGWLFDLPLPSWWSLGVREIAALFLVFVHGPLDLCGCDCVDCHHGWREGEDHFQDRQASLLSQRTFLYKRLEVEVSWYYLHLPALPTTLQRWGFVDWYPGERRLSRSINSLEFWRSLWGWFQLTYDQARDRAGESWWQFVETGGDRGESPNGDFDILSDRSEGGYHQLAIVFQMEAQPISARLLWGRLLGHAQADFKSLWHRYGWSGRDTSCQISPIGLRGAWVASSHCAEEPWDFPWAGCSSGIDWCWAAFWRNPDRPMDEEANDQIHQAYHSKRCHQNSWCWRVVLWFEETVHRLEEQWDLGAARRSSQDLISWRLH